MARVLPRQLIVDRLVAGLTAGGWDPDQYDIHPAGRTVDGLTVPTAWIVLDQVTPGVVASSWLTVTARIIAATPRTEAGTADDDIDDWLLQLLAALDHVDADGLDWQTATRSTLDDTWPAVEITLTIQLTRLDD